MNVCIFLKILSIMIDLRYFEKKMIDLQCQIYLLVEIKIIFFSLNINKKMNILLNLFLCNCLCFLSRIQNSKEIENKKERKLKKSIQVNTIRLLF
jgi:Ca2+/Na+ antiporter